MAKKGPPRSEERRTYWQAAVELYRESGLSVRQFCQQEGLAESAFYYWRRELSQRDEPPRQQSPPQFVPVEIQAASSPPLVVELACGAKLSIGEGCSPELLRSVLESLRC